MTESSHMVEIRGSFDPVLIPFISFSPFSILGGPPIFSNPILLSHSHFPFGNIHLGSPKRGGGGGLAKKDNITDRLREWDSDRGVQKILNLCERHM